MRKAKDRAKNGAYVDLEAAKSVARGIYDRVCNEIARTKVDTAQGISCMQCCRPTVVMEAKRMVGGVIKRTRECPRCGHTIYTTERCDVTGIR